MADNQYPVHPTQGAGEDAGDAFVNGVREGRFIGEDADIYPILKDQNVSEFVRGWVLRQFGGFPQIEPQGTSESDEVYAQRVNRALIQAERQTYSADNAGQARLDLYNRLMTHLGDVGTLTFTQIIDGQTRTIRINPASYDEANSRDGANITNQELRYTALATIITTNTYTEDEYRRLQRMLPRNNPFKGVSYQDYLNGTHDGNDLPNRQWGGGGLISIAGDGCGFNPVIFEGGTIMMPPGEDVPFFMQMDCRGGICVPRPFAAAPVIAAAPAPAAGVIVREDLRYVAPISAPSADGRMVTPDTVHGSFQLLADVGAMDRNGRPLAREWYALRDIAARVPALFVRDWGQTEVRDFRIGGQDIAFTGNAISNLDDQTSAETDNDRGRRQRLFIAGYIQATKVDGTHIEISAVGPNNEPGPRERITLQEAAERTGVPLVDLQAAPTGTFFRYDRNIFETAHRNTPDSGFDPIIGFTDPPRGFVFTPPSTQMPFDSELQRYGISVGTHTVSAEDYFGRITLSRDTQARNDGALGNTPDRIVARAFLHSHNVEFAEAMAAYAALPTDAAPQARRDAALRAAVLFREISDNKLVRTVDANTLPMRRRNEALLQYFGRTGVTIDPAFTQAVEAAPHVPPRYFGEDIYNQLQDVTDHGGNNPQHMHLRDRLRQPIAGWEGFVDQVFPVQNASEFRIARGYTQLRPEYSEDTSNLGMVNLTWATWQGLPVEARRQMAGMIGRNREAATDFAEGLTRVLANPELYGFDNRREAREYVLRFANGNEDIERELLRVGSTTQLPGQLDQAHNVQNISGIMREIGAYVNTDAGFAQYQDLMNRAGDPANLPVSRDGERLSDGRPLLVSQFRVLGRERGTSENGEGTTLAAMLAIDGVNDRALIQTTTDANIYAHTGVSAVNQMAYQYVDAFMASYGRGLSRGMGERYEVATESEYAGTEERLRSGGGNWRILNTGAFQTRAIFEAGQQGDNARAFDLMFRSPEADATGAASIAVMGLQNKPALAFDTVLFTMGRDPSAYDNAIEDLRDLASTTRVSRYRDLASALSDTRNIMQRYQRQLAAGDPDARETLERAMERLADFRYDAELRGRGNGGAWRDNAWSQFINLAARDPRASEATVDAIAANESLRDPVIATIPQTLQFLDMNHGSNRGRTSGGWQLPENWRGDRDYSGTQYIDMPIDPETRRPVRRPTANVDAFMQALAGASNTAQPTVTAPAVQTVDVSGTAIQSGNAVATLSAALQQAGITPASLTQAELAGGPAFTQDQLAGALINAGRTLSGQPATTVSGVPSAITPTIIAAAVQAYNQAQTAVNSGLPALTAGAPGTSSAAATVNAADVSADVIQAAINAGVAPVAYLPAGENGQPNAAAVQAALAATIQQQINAGAIVPAGGQDANTLAAAMINAGIINSSSVITSAGELTAAAMTQSGSSASSDAVLGGLAAAAGGAKWWLIAWYRLTNQTLIPGVDEGFGGDFKTPFIDVDGDGIFNPGVDTWIGPVGPEGGGFAEFITLDGRTVWVPLGLLADGILAIPGLVGAVRRGDDEEERNRTTVPGTNGTGARYEVATVSVVAPPANIIVNPVEEDQARGGAPLRS